MTAGPESGPPPQGIARAVRRTRLRSRRRPGESFLGFQVRRLRTFLWPPAVNPRLILAERGHPLVRAEMLRRRRSRLVGAVAAAFGTLALWVAVLATAELTGEWGPDCLAARLGAVLLIFLPLAAVLAAALGAAGAVLAERTENTALQMVLTPLPRRTLLAAKTWPHLRVPLCGLAAALPLYLMLGSSASLTGSPLCVFSPLRALLVPVRGSSASPWTFDWSPQSIGIGSLMWLTDLGLVWAAAQWGAAAAVRRLSLARVAWDVIASLAGVAGFLYLAILMLVILLGLPALLVGLVTEAAVGIDNAPGDTIMIVTALVLAALGVAALATLWWRHVICKPVHDALTAFAWFDAVADDDLRPPPPNQPLARWHLPPARR